MDPSQLSRADQEKMEAFQAKQMMKMVSDLQNKCFTDCINDFTSSKLSSKESSCVGKCVDKYFRLFERASLRMNEYNENALKNA